MISASRPLDGIISSVHFVCRRVLFAVAPRLANRRFAFTIGCVSVLGAKAVHILAHFNALPTADLLRWGSSFFAQDTVLLLVLRLLIEGQLCATVYWFGLVGRVAASAVIGFVLLLAGISMSFYAVAGLELQWRNVTVAGDSSSWKMLLTGLISCAVVWAALLAVAFVLQVLCYTVAGMALDILKWPTTYLLGRLPARGRAMPLDAKYEHLPQHDVAYTEDGSKTESQSDCSDLNPRPTSTASGVLLYTVVGVSLLVQAVCTVLRPDESSMVYLSWTLPLMPFVDFAHSSPSLATLLAISSSVNDSLDNRTALADPIPLSWLPKDTKLAGFEDWYEEGKKHYSASADPLKLCNLDEEMLPELRDTDLAEVPIRHVMMIFLESTRKDVFPLKREGVIWDRLVNTFDNKSLPAAALDRLATLTPTARFLTGDYRGRFDEIDVDEDELERRDEQPRRRGGINANNVSTTSTYTLKSLAGTLCGLSPLLADFNVDQAHHIYQPCLPQIFEALNQLDQADDDVDPEDFRSFKWRSAFMQSVTDGYDKQDLLMPVLGYVKEHQGMIESSYLRGSPKFGTVNMSDINYYGMPEVALEDYIHDAFAKAKRNNERLFLSHLTSTTHHPFGIPEGEPYVRLVDSEDCEDLSRYLNAVGYVDRWLAKILRILDVQGVTNETLLVLVGDHGLSIAERGSVTPYNNPNIANFRVPLVISHPALPQIDIDDPVTSIQILPTLLDLLTATSSLPPSSAAAATDLLHNYEGQSLLRPIHRFSKDTGQGSWQFTIMNPGGSTLAVRDARQPDWRLIVPVYGNYEWRFSDLGVDPSEKRPFVSFDFDRLRAAVRRGVGDEAVLWAEEAAAVAGWWAKENYKRWRYTP